MNKIGKDLGFSRRETESIAFFLKGEGLMDFKTMGGWVGLTHYGIQQVEAALSTPDTPTEYFPPVVNIVHVGSMQGSQILQAGDRASQAVSSRTFDASEVLELIKKLRAAVAQAPPPTTDDALDLERHIATIETQAQSPRGSRVIIQEALSTVRTILEGAGGNVLASTILTQLTGLFRP